MEYKVRVRDKFYNYILHGTKRIEIRLNDEKRQQMHIGDNLTFINFDNQDESFDTKVVDLLRYKSIEDIIDDNDMALLADSSMTKEELIDTFNTFFTKEEQDKYGIVGIKIELI